MKAWTLLAALGFAFAAQADDPRPADFQWRASVDTAPHQGLVRLPLPAEALQRLQAPDAADLRVFDAAGRPVPFALASPPLPKEAARQPTATLPALPLHAARPGQAAPAGTVQLRVERGGREQTLWFQLAGPGQVAAGAASPLPAALFDARAVKQPINAITVQGRLPPNVPVRVGISTSTNLAHWEPVAVRGRLFRFEGEGAPANDTLELAAPLVLEGRYLRLKWEGFDGVEVHGVTGLQPATRPPATRPSAALPAPYREDAQALEWQLGFATPIAQLAISTEQPNTLLPLRILGRNQPSEPWRRLGQTVVYRLGGPGQESTSEPVTLSALPVRWLRLETTHGQRLDGVPLAVRVLFDPVEVVFVAGTGGPYQLATGRAGTPAAALPLRLLPDASKARIEALPLARITATQADAPPTPPSWARWLPALDRRTAALWAVLLAGVLVLGVVAWSLLRQLKGR
ncbi:MAG TPA: DUF3999 family protein [Ramlibacter sp.]|nr:DUF3999 family protein [Ramlibacter sp.]